MLVFTLFACLIGEIILSVKLYLLNPKRRLNIYLALIPAIFSIDTILEIILLFTQNVDQANHLFFFYQALAFSPLVLLALGAAEYLDIYTDINADTLTILKTVSVSMTSFSVLLVIFTGQTCRIFLSAPGKWSIDPNTVGYSMLGYIYCNIVSIAIISTMFVYLMLKTDSLKKKRWFGALSVCQILTMVGLIFFIGRHHKGTSPGYDLIASIPATLNIFLQTWVLSNFTSFDVTPKNIYTDVLGAINNWIIVLNKKGAVLYVNKIVEKATRNSYFELTNLNIDNIIEVQQNQVGMSVKQFIQSSFNSDFCEISIKTKKSQQLFNFQSSLKKVLLPDQTEVFLWVLVDTTKMETLRIQKEIIEATAVQREKAYDDIEFVMNITSHDLKVPIDTIVALTDMAMQKNGPSASNKSGEHLGLIKFMGLQTQGILDQLIEYMRIGVVEKKRTWLNVADLIKELKQAMTIQVEKSAATIVHKGLKDIYCDQWHIRELLRNIIDNSMKYQGKDPPHIEIEVTQTETMYQFTISDNGIGIHDSFMPKLFLKYGREGRKQVAGTGLGLSLCRSIVKSNNGEITINNNHKGNGITIFFTISKKDTAAA